MYPQSSMTPVDYKLTRNKHTRSVKWDEHRLSRKWQSRAVNLTRSGQQSSIRGGHNFAFDTDSVSRITAALRPGPRRHVIIGPVVAEAVCSVIRPVWPDEWTWKSVENQLPNRRNYYLILAPGSKTGTLEPLLKPKEYQYHLVLFFLLPIFFDYNRFLKYLF